MSGKYFWFPELYLLTQWDLLPNTGRTSKPALWAMSHFGDNIFTTGKYNLILELWKTWECVVKSPQELYLKFVWMGINGIKIYRFYPFFHSVDWSSLKKIISSRILNSRVSSLTTNGDLFCWRRASIKLRNTRVIP